MIYLQVGNSASSPLTDMRCSNFYVREYKTKEVIITYGIVTKRKIICILRKNKRTVYLYRKYIKNSDINEGGTAIIRPSVSMHRGAFFRK